MLLLAAPWVPAVAGTASSVAAGAESSPAAEAPIGYEGARHLLNRVGFGASDAEIRGLAPLGRGEAVDRLLREARREATLAPPGFVNEPFEPYYRLRNMTAEQRMAAQRALIQQ